MKKYKICKILLVILAIFLCVAFMNCSESALHIKAAGSVQYNQKETKMGHGTNAVKIQNGQ